MPLSDPPLPVSSSFSVAQHLARAVSRGDLRPGERLPSERVLAERFGISRQSVRKAIQMLASAAVIEVRSGLGAGSGSYIASTQIPVELIDPHRERPSFSDVARILEARRLFELPVALFAGMRMDDRDYDDIKEVLDMQYAAADLEGIRSLDIRFHLAIAAATHNSVVQQQMESLLQELEIARHVVPEHSSDQEAEETLDIHTRTLEAIASRDPRRITETMDEHMSKLEVAWETASGRKLSDQTRAVGYTFAS